MKRIISLGLTVLMLAAIALGCVSCGSDVELNFGKECVAVATQLDALNGLKKGDADLAVIDSVMAGYYMKSGNFNDYQTLKFVLATEEYGIAAKKGNEALMSKINEAMIALADSEYKTIAEKYGLTSETLVTKDTANPYANATDGSFDAVKTSKKLVIGYTLFAPIAYNDENNALVGFDVDLARAVVRYINTTYNTEIEVEFTVIDWNNKETLLQNGTIDLAWNGMTITPERSSAMTISVPYLRNQQAVVCKKTDASKYESADLREFERKVVDAIVIVESGSAGEELVKKTEN